MMSELEQKNLDVARAFVEDFLGRGDPSVADAVLAEDVQAMTGLKLDGLIVGREQYKQIFSAFFAVFPPVFPLEIGDLFAAGDRVVVRFRSTQKHAQDFFGVAATNRTIVFVETHVMRLRDGKIVGNVVSATNLEFEILMAPALTPLILK